MQGGCRRCPDGTRNASFRGWPVAKGMTAPAPRLKKGVRPLRGVGVASLFLLAAARSAPPAVRVLIPQGDPITVVAQHIQRLQQAGRRILYVTADRSHPSLATAFTKQGIDADELQFLDAAGHKPENTVSGGVALIVPAPSMLELLAMRCEQLIYQVGPEVHVIIDSLNALVSHNDSDAVESFTKYMARRLRLLGVPGDFVLFNNIDGMLLLDHIESCTDSRLLLGAPHADIQEESS